MSLFSKLHEMVKGYRTVCVAIIGGKKSGKTVLLTALANHLRKHDPKELDLGGWTVAYDASASVALDMHKVHPFDYQGTRDALTRGNWPSKTTEPSMSAMRLKLKKDGKEENVLLELMDLPGERVADFPMINQSYKEWCCWMERAMAGTGRISDSYRKYLDRVRSLGFGDENALKDAYRDFLGEEYEAHSVLITPSTVKLELNGTQHGGYERGAFRSSISNTPIGLGGNEFIPLPGECFDEGSPWQPLAMKYSKTYDYYKKVILDSAAKWLAGATKLFYLVDMLSLLESMLSVDEKGCVTVDPTAGEHEKAFADATIAVLCPRKPDGALGRLGDWFKKFMWRSGVNSLYVVATKSDLILRDQRDNLRVLTSKFMGDALDILDANVKTAVVSCAAVRSTEDGSVDGRPALRGRKLERAEIRECTWIPSDVPDHIPTAEELKNLLPSYPMCFPYFDPNRFCAPKQLGLDAIVKAMLDL